MEKKEENKPPCYGNPTRLCHLKVIRMGMPDYWECRECVEKYFLRVGEEKF